MLQIMGKCTSGHILLYGELEQESLLSSES